MSPYSLASLGTHFSNFIILMALLQYVYAEHMIMIVLLMTNSVHSFNIQGVPKKTQTIEITYC